MSAVAAAVCRDGGAPAPDGLARMSDALHGFGAKSFARCDDVAGLVRKVPESFTPEDAADRGIVEVGDGRLLLFDGFLHHRRDLIGALGLAPREAREWPDSALFARAWRCWSEDAGLRVEGEFTVVVWDPGRRTLTALCSPLWAPPLFFSIDRRRALVASAPCAIFAWGDLPRRLNDAYLASGLILDYGDRRGSYYEHVRTLQPGELLTVTPDAHRIRGYYELAERVEPVRLPRDSDYVDAAGELLRGAVDSALRATETPSISLSGGLDSPMVAVAALELLAGSPGSAPLVSFTAVPEPGWDGRLRGGDEGPLVRKLHERYPALDARFVESPGLDADHLQLQMIERAELPMRNPGNMYWIHEVRRLSRAAGRRTLLTGGSGNGTLTFTGAPRLASLLRTWRWPTLLREAAALPQGRFGPLRPLIKHALPRQLPGWAVRARWRRRGGWRYHSAIHPEFARRMRVDERARAHRFGPYVPEARSCPEGQIRMLCNPHKQGPGRSVRVALQALHDVAARDPLGDRRLVEWCLGLPDEQYMHRGQFRRLVRRLAEGRLPAELLSATVTGGQAADWHLRLGRRLPRLRRTFEDWRGDPEVAGRLDLDRLLRILDTLPAETPLTPADYPDHIVAEFGIDRALATGRFIRWVASGGSRS